MRLKAVITGLVAGAVIFGSALAVNPAGTFASGAVPGGFKDVGPSHWAAAYVADLAAYRAIDGFADGTFRPEEKVTRAQFAKMLVAATQARPKAAALSGKTPEFSEIQQDESACKFADMQDPNLAWARPYVGGAVKAGVIKGYSDGRFGPNDCITRAQLAAMIGRLLPNKYAKNPPFKDAPAWARSDIGKAWAVGAVSGFTDGTFRPNDPATRAQVAKMLSALLNGSDIGNPYQPVKPGGGGYVVVPKGPDGVPVIGIDLTKDQPVPERPLSELLSAFRAAVDKRDVTAMVECVAPECRDFHRALFSMMKPEDLKALSYALGRLSVPDTVRPPLSANLPAGDRHVSMIFGAKDGKWWVYNVAVM